MSVRNAFKHNGQKDGVVMKRNRLLREIKQADVGTSCESNPIFNGMKLSNCQGHRK